VTARTIARASLCAALVSTPALAQTVPPPAAPDTSPSYPQPSPGYAAPAQYPTPTFAPAPPVASAPVRSPEASNFEISTLYVVGASYGVGLGVWLDSEIGVKDPGIALVAPAILGVSAPIGVFVLDHPAMPRGEPAAIAAGLAIGGAEGLGIAGTQVAVSDKANSWGFRGLGRSVALGSTLGGVGGYVLGEAQDPSPKLSGFVSSGVLWGTAIGASFGYGVSPKGVGYGHSNDYAAVGGLIGLNVGLLATAGLSTITVPGWNTISGMWIGAGIGAAASLPVFLFYVGDNSPPAKRGLVFTGTAITVGILAGAIFSSADPPDATLRANERHPPASANPSFATITSVVPFTVPGGGAGLSVSGILE